MPTPDQLAHVDPVDGDGSSAVKNDDGTTTTSWPDGTSRVDNTDGSSTITFPDFSVLNIETDGTRTLNDASGAALDPTTGQPLSGSPDPVPTPPPTSVEELTDIVEGASTIADLAAAEGILRGLGVAAVVDKQYGALFELAGALSEALKGELSPTTWFLQPVKMLLAVIKAAETEERGAGMRSWCYTVLYSAMGMGDPPEPTFSGSLAGPDQDAVDKKWWEESRDQAKEQLGDGQKGVALANRTLLLVAKCGGDPASAITELWAAACTASGDDGGGGLLAAYAQLGWPQPTGA